MPAFSAQSGPDAFDFARRKARYGHRSWAVWKDRAGAFHADRLHRESIKAAMLATGTQRHWWVVEPNGVTFIQSWACACLLRRNWRFLQQPA